MTVRLRYANLSMAQLFTPWPVSWISLDSELDWKWNITVVSYVIILL